MTTQCILPKYVFLWEDSEHEVKEAVEHQIYTIGRARNVG